jgi:hypothetical protein
MDEDTYTRPDAFDEVDAGRALELARVVIRFVGECFPPQETLDTGGKEHG